MNNCCQTDKVLLLTDISNNFVVEGLPALPGNTTKIIDKRRKDNHEIIDI